MPVGASLASMQSDQANRFLFPEKYPRLVNKARLLRVRR
jgi:hypothetical protein